MEIWLTVGLPASGKTTWAKEQMPKCDAVRISPDDIRFDTGASIAESWMVARSNLMDAIKEKKEVIILDATNLDKTSRREWIKLAGLTGYKVKTFLFDGNFELFTQRNSVRPENQRVPDAVMRRFKDRLSWPSDEEGFEEVTWVTKSEGNGN